MVQGSRAGPGRHQGGFVGLDSGLAGDHRNVGVSRRLVSHIKSVKTLRLLKDVVGDFGSKDAGKRRRLLKALLKHGHA